MRPMPIVQVLRQTFTLLKASQKLGIWREWFEIERESVYEIDPCSPFFSVNA